MVILTEQIEIPASYERLKAWTANFEEEFVKWSPYHIECNLYNLTQIFSCSCYLLFISIPHTQQLLSDPPI